MAKKWSDFYRPARSLLAVFVVIPGNYYGSQSAPGILRVSMANIDGCGDVIGNATKTV
jgi:hypothetical protein